MDSETIKQMIEELKLTKEKEQFLIDQIKEALKGYRRADWIPLVSEFYKALQLGK